ncbi:MAG: hypothetical protein KGL39_43515 [Patescibacteria group bacterium]|nr:hypothetical protein [Patescibacteria group bacterium]
MSATITYPSGTNTYVPNLEGSNNLLVDFGRNVQDFAINRYTQIAPVKTNVGLYTVMTVEEAGRILDTDGANFAWADGQDFPERNEGNESFQFNSFNTIRRGFGYKLGRLSTEQAAWDIQSQHARIKAQQAMTMRTYFVMNALTTTANYSSNHYSAVSSISGNSGNFAQSTTARQDIKRSLNYAAQQIMLDTLSAVKGQQLILVIGPALAASLAATQEIVDYIKGSKDAAAAIKGEVPGYNKMFGLPDQLYGYELIVDDASYVTSRKGATRAASFVWPSTTAVMLARPGDLVAPSNEGPNFSTCTLFMKEEMTVENDIDQWHRLTRGRVTEDYQAALTAPVTGFVFTSAA